MNLCWHNALHPVTLNTGETVAQLCGDCGAELPPEFGCPDCSYAEIHSYGSINVGRVLAEHCHAHSRQLLS